MRKNLKRITAVVCAIATFGCMSVSAAWNFAGYDTSDPNNILKIYNEVVNNKYTSKFITEKLPDDQIEWKFEGYEAAYPHTGYERLYLEGNPQNAITRLTNLYPQWETRYRDYFWEVYGNHKIYQRQQTKINNKSWAWDYGNDKLGIPDTDLLVFSNRYADTTTEFKNCGIANLDNEGNYVFDINGKVYDKDAYAVYNRFAMPKAFNVVLDSQGNPSKQIAEGDFLHSYNLSRVNSDGKYEVSNAEIADYIQNKLGIPATKFVTGPSFYGENPTKDVAKMWLDNGDIWDWDNDTAITTGEINIEWTEQMYEMEEPYYYYQYLIVNGLVLDGRNDTPRVWRYTNGKATPDVEWRYFATEDVYPFEVVQVKYIRNNDGNMIVAVDEDGDPIVRYPTGEYGNCYFKVTDTEVEIWVKDDYADSLILKYSRVDGPFGDISEGTVLGSYDVE